SHASRLARATLFPYTTPFRSRFPDCLPLVPAIALVAGVAVATLPVLVDLLAEVLQDVARPAVRGLAEPDHALKLLLVACPALLVVDEIPLEIDVGEHVAHPLPCTAAVLAHGTVPLEQHEGDARFPSRNARSLRYLVKRDRSFLRV